MSNAQKSWDNAENACLGYLAKITKYTVGENALLGDALPDDKANLFAFQLSGGADQVQNRQVPAPACQWLCDGELIGQFEERSEAKRIAGLMMDGLPAYENDENTGELLYRGIAPNVNLFEMTLFPNIQSLALLGESDDSDSITVWMLTVFFRCQFSNEQN